MTLLHSHDTSSSQLSCYIFNCGFTWKQCNGCHDFEKVLLDTNGIFIENFWSVYENVSLLHGSGVIPCVKKSFLDTPIYLSWWFVNHYSGDDKCFINYIKNKSTYVYIFTKFSIHICTCIQCTCKCVKTKATINWKENNNVKTKLLQIFSHFIQFLTYHCFHLAITWY